MAQLEAPQYPDVMRKIVVERPWEVKIDMAKVEHLTREELVEVVRYLDELATYYEWSD
jgi:hypothetical protein